jgi:hypothetical protein
MIRANEEISMITYHELAQHLQTITGLRFEIEEDHIVSTTSITPVSEFLMNQAAEYADLYMQHTGGKFYVPLDAITKEAGDSVQTMARIEDERVHQLEEMLLPLIEKTGIPFTFDKSHRMLVAPNPAWEDPLGYETEHGRIVMDIRQLRPGTDFEVLAPADQLRRIEAIAYLNDAGAIEGVELAKGTLASTIAIYDVNPPVLRTTECLSRMPVIRFLSEILKYLKKDCAGDPRPVAP